MTIMILIYYLLDTYYYYYYYYYTAHLHTIDIKFTNFGYYSENSRDNMSDELMPVSFVNFYNCLFDNWELKCSLVKAITKLKFSRMLLIWIL